jgi:Transposase DDE domain
MKDHRSGPEDAMEGFAKEVCKRLPLGEATLRLFDFISEEDFLGDVFERYRGRSYQDIIRFPLFVQLITDALLQHGGSGHRSFQNAVENEELEATIRAMYGKLARVPISLSVGFFGEATRRLEQVFPAAENPLPKSLREFEPTAIDGKKIKHVAKRLKALRKLRGHVLGGKIVAAMSLRTNLAVALGANPDGEVSDAPLVPDVLAQARGTSQRPRLWIADRQFCDLIQPEQFTAEGDHFVIRYNAKVKFQRDSRRPVKMGVTEEGLAYQEEWGWLGSSSNRRRRYVRRITLKRPDAEDVILVTDLLDENKYPATDLLAVYLMRWGIECMFQRVTEVFHLRTLIGSTPQATVFQASFCLLLYNLIQVIRQYIADAQEIEPETISTENLFDDVTRQLISWTEMLSTRDTVALMQTTWTAAQLARRLEELLRHTWRDAWRKAPSSSHTPQRNDQQYLKGGHNSVYRILRDARRASKKSA